MSTKILVFGGVYSNLQALHELKSWAKSNDFSPEQIFCTGDIVGYCAQPQECVDEVIDWGIRSIAGNVEIQLRNGDLDCGCNFNEDSSCDIYSRQWYPFAQQNVNQNGVNWMKTLPEQLVFEFGGARWGIVHGSFHETSEFLFESCDWSKKEASFSELNVDYMLAGHCGLPFVHQQNGQAWINSGALGMPANDGTDRTWFCTIEDKDGAFVVQYHSLEYEMHETASYIKEFNLPSVYGATLLSGLWDSLDILTEPEKAKTGIPYHLDEKQIHIAKFELLHKSVS